MNTNIETQEPMKVTMGKEWADVKEINWENATELKAGVATALSIPEHGLCQFVLQTEGILSSRH